jgi:hypothetical protein
MRKIREGLVFKPDGSIVGFVDIGDINNSIKLLEAKVKEKEMEEEVADHVLTVMARGLFINLKYPLANFPTKGKSSTCFGELTSPYKMYKYRPQWI